MTCGHSENDPGRPTALSIELRKRPSTGSGEALRAKPLAYNAFSSSVTAPTDFLASPNSMEVWSA